MNKKAEKRVVLGGTFDVIHEGHKALFRRAFGLGEVTIGLTSDRMAGESRKRKVNRFGKRKKALEKLITQEFKRKPGIIKLNDKYGSSLKEDFDYIVVSPATLKTALEINRKRKKAGKGPIKIIKIRFVLGGDGKPLSATGLLKSKN